MQFLDSAGVRQFKQYNDSKYVVTEDVSTIDTPTRDTYTKDEIDEMLTHVTVTETDPIFTASAASGITSNDITSWNGKQDSISDLSTIRSGAALGATSVQTETDPVFSASVAAGITSSDITNWNSKTSNTGTITGITMNGASKGTSGVVDLGTVITAHQDISGKADKSAAIGSLSLSLNSTDYKITLSGTKVDGTTFTVSDVIDLPLESVVVNGSYDDTTKKVVLTLKNGNTVDFSIADLIAGLQSEITSTNKLSADLIADGTTNKVVTATEKSTWNGKQDAISDLATIRSNAEAGAAKVSNVQSDWNANSGLAQILNKPTIPTTLDQIADGSTRKLSNFISGSKSDSQMHYNDIAQVNALYDSPNDALYALPNCDLIEANPEMVNFILATTNDIPTESTVSGWGFTKNAGTITGITMNGSSKGTSGVVNLGTVVTSETDPVYSASAAAGITSTDITNWNNKVSNVQSDWNATTGAAVILNKPTIPAAVTESTVSGWGFTKNSGTVTGVKMNGTTKTPTSGTVDLGTVITSETSLSKGTTTGSGNAVTDISVSGHTITLTKGSTFLTSETQLSKGTTSGSGNVVTDLSVSGHTVTLTKGSNVPVATSANAGKIPMITSSGGWEYVTPSAIYSGSATPNNNTGNNGDIYLQTS